MVAKKANPRTSNGYRRKQLIARVKAMAEPCWICGLPIDPNTAAGSPYAFEVDEVIPVSKGGSPFSFNNARAAHRCCNNWRSNKPVYFVEYIKRKINSLHKDIRDPQEFIAYCKQLEHESIMPNSVYTPQTTTRW